MKDRKGSVYVSGLSPWVSFSLGELGESGGKLLVRRGRSVLDLGFRVMLVAEAVETQGGLLSI